MKRSVSVCIIGLAVIFVVLALINHGRVILFKEATPPSSSSSLVKQTGSVEGSRKTRSFSMGIERKLPDKLLHLMTGKQRNNRKVEKYSGDWRMCRQFSCKFVHLNGSVSMNYDGGGHSDTLCADVLFDMLVSVRRTFEKFGIVSYLTFGSLLGAVHTGGIFEWTRDVDIAINSTAFGSTLIQNAASSLFQEAGLVLYRGGQRLFRICPSQKFFRLTNRLSSMYYSQIPKRQLQFLNRIVYIDVYEEYQEASGIIKINPSEASLSRNDIYPLKDCQLRGLELFKCPHNSSSFLSKHYGKGKWNHIMEV